MRSRTSDYVFVGVLAVVGVLFLAVVGIQATKIGQVNPAETLRSE